MADRHLAQLNMGRLSHPADHPAVAEFMDNLELINGLAERSPGFVWRLQDEAGNATGLGFPGFETDPQVIANVSVWESAAELQDFVFNTVHVRFYKKRAAWFEVQKDAHFVMWWIPQGHRPDLIEAADRLAHLRAQGDTPDAFGWSYLADNAAWRAARCDLRPAV